MKFGYVVHAIMIAAFPVASAIAAAEESIQLSLGDGKVIVDNISFIQPPLTDDKIPRLIYRITNNTGKPLVNIGLRFDVGGFCAGRPKQCTINSWVTIPRLEGLNVKLVSHLELKELGMVNECRDWIHRVTLLPPSSPENTSLAADGQIDLIPELEAMKSKVDEIEAAERAALKAQADRELKAQQEKLRREEAERRRAVAAEKSRRAAQEASEERERRKKQEDRERAMRVCSEVYKATADRKLSDLTVREDQLVRSCQAVGMYPPK